MRRLFLIFFVVVLFGSFLYAGSYPDKGRNIWKRNCRLACHDGKKADSPKLAPNSKTQLQWKNVFANERRYIKEVHKGITDFKNFTEEDWKRIEAFVINHAYDSDQPESCETTEHFIK